MRLHLREIRAEDERSGHHRPERELAARFLGGDAGIASDDEVGVVPVSRLREPAQVPRVPVVVHHAVPAVRLRAPGVEDLDVRPEPPELPVLTDPSHDRQPVRSVLEARGSRLGQHDGPPGRSQSGALRGVGLAVGLLPRLARRDPDEASVKLQVVHAEGHEQHRVLREVIAAAALRLTASRKSSAGARAGVFVDAELQAQGMQVRPKPCHAVGELVRVGNQVAL